jgi:hypothetical protein
MARPLRIEYAGALYHVTSRGDRQEAIFDDDQDRTAFLNILGAVIMRFRWRCHAYCRVMQWGQVRIPSQIGHPFRRKSATCSEANRPGLRSKSATPLGIG